MIVEQRRRRTCQRAAACWRGRAGAGHSPPPVRRRRVREGKSGVPCDEPRSVPFVFSREGVLCAHPPRAVESERRANWSEKKTPLPRGGGKGVVSHCAAMASLRCRVPRPLHPKLPCCDRPRRRRRSLRAAQESSSRPWPRRRRAGSSSSESFGPRCFSR